MMKRVNTFQPVRFTLLLAGVLCLLLAAGCGSVPSPSPTRVDTPAPVTPTPQNPTQTFTATLEPAPTASPEPAVTLHPVSGGAAILASNAAALQLAATWNAYANTLAFSPDSSLLATAGIDRVIRLYTIPSMAEVRQLAEPPDMGYLYSLAFSPDGSLL
ncbi:MAG: hypothetical protein AAGU25_08430, partial [bacterium]